MPDSKKPVPEPAPIERQFNVTPSVLREPLTTIDVEMARDQKLNENFNTELAAETPDVNNGQSELVTGMGGGDDPIVDGVEVPSDLEDMTPMFEQGNAHIEQSDMAPASGQSEHPEDARRGHQAVPQKKGEAEHTSGSYTENDPEDKADSDVPAPQ